MYIAGALTETLESGDLLRCRIADPTGGFDIVAGGRSTSVAQMLKKIPVPSFVALSGCAQMYQKNRQLVLSVRPEQVQVIERACRDQMLLITAEYTLRRLEQLRGAVDGTCTDDRFLRTARHYATTLPKILELAGMVEGAVRSVRPQDSPVASGGPDVRAVVMELMQNTTGPRGIAVDEILEKLALKGIRKEEVLAALESLILDDECYQPQKGYVKPL
jgi:RPA family protein